MVKAGCYAVARGRVPGVYMEWSDCESQVINFKGAKYKKFLHAADAELWVHQNAVGPYAGPKAPSVTAPPTASLASVKSPEARETFTPRSPSSRAASSSSAKTGEVYSSLRSGERGASAEEPRDIPQHTTLPSTGKESVTTTMSSNTMVVYTDGCCRGNGRVGSVAGVGVWWGKDDPRNISERCPGQQTNNRAELIAIIRVLETTRRDRPLLIKTDSEYSIKSMTKWIWSWKARGWRTSTGGPVQNLPVIKYLDILLDERRRILKQSVQFEKVPAHTGLEGNEGADVLANAGAILPPVPDPDWEALAQKIRDRIETAPFSQASASGRASSIPCVVPSPQKTKVQSVVPKQPVTTVPQAPTKANSQPVTPRNTPSRPSTVASVSSTSSMVSRQSSLRSQASSTTSTTSNSTSGRIPRFPSSLSEVTVHGSLETTISQKELEALAACVLSHHDFLREAHEAGL